MKVTAAQLQAQLPRGCFLAVLNENGADRVVIVWTGNGPMPREVLAKFGTAKERRENADQQQTTAARGC